MEYVPNEILNEKALAIFKELKTLDKWRSSGTKNLKKDIDKLKDELDSMISIQRSSERVIMTKIHAIMDQTDPEGL